VLCGGALFVRGCVHSNGSVLLLRWCPVRSKIEAGELALEPRPFSPILCVEEAVDMVAVSTESTSSLLVLPPLFALLMRLTT